MPTMTAHPASQLCSDPAGNTGAAERRHDTLVAPIPALISPIVQAACCPPAQLSLELPGSGVMRLAGSPKEYSCASEGEENAAL